ncbi:hypothetical protein OAJ94_03930 [Deltaproteobacteria bacterium]|nr:hypothetical protein [Deltaproteobacteria bacterium]
MRSENKESANPPTPEEYHASFTASATHIEEVRAIHAKVMRNTGLVAETHLSQIAPSRIIEWLADELNGVSDANGIRLPLMGLAPDDVDISVSTDNGISSLKLSLGDHIERVVPLPIGVSSVSTEWSDGNLEIKFLSDSS